MSKYLSESGLSYLWGKIKSIFATKTELAGHPTGRIYYGTCSTTANTYVKEATVETFPLDVNNKPLVGTVVAIKFTVTNTYKTEGQTYALNVNNTGEYPMYYNNAAVATSTSANTLVAGYKNRHVFYVFNGTQWVWLSAGYDTNTTYSGMTQAEIDAGTSTTARLITPARLRDNFYTEGEVDTLLADKADSEDIPTVPTNVSAFTNDAGYITGYTETDPVFAASAAHGITSSDITNWNGKQAAIGDLADIRSGAALGATALQSFTESDPTVPAWAKASTKPSYTASEVGALPDDTQLFSGDYNDLDNKPTIPAAVTESTVSGWGFTKNTGTYSKPSGGIPETDLASAVQTSLGKADTALQSYTETDPTVPSWAKQSTKPSYTASEVGALPDTTVIPAAPGTLNTTATTAQSTSSSEALSGSITLHKVAKTGTYSDLIGKPTIPTVPTALSAFTDDLGSNPTHTHSQYLTSAPVTSVNGQTGAVSLTIPSAVTESTVTGWGFTKNGGTVTSTGGTTAVNNIQVVSALPASPDANTLYLIPE